MEGKTLKTVTIGTRKARGLEARHAAAVDAVKAAHSFLMGDRACGRMEVVHMLTEVLSEEATADWSSRRRKDA